VERAEATETTAVHTSHAGADDKESAGHPSPLAYIKVAAVLAVVTAAEVAVYYVSSLRTLLVPLLLGMSAVKFFLVAMWFMHLKFDSKMFRRLFVLGIILAIAIYGIAFATLDIFNR
jgi:cytochrome c oxidase subunit 4